MIRRLRKSYFHATRRKPLCRLDADKATPDDDATLYGERGDDTFIAGGGARQTLRGWLGDDTYELARGNGAVRIADSEGRNGVRFGAGGVRELGNTERENPVPGTLVPYTRHMTMAIVREPENQSTWRSAA